ncbi:polysaccharide deacetylase family protein [Thermosediminibacter litoriperuensis]|uniref:Polysaccharide deacetylase family sporulation protein PdaB n=1 Tax=Thermosediminibacter litoriperuensis TaxID=291989 RepID=A0A5S5AQJ5_9FIRM|nr:polysaccharide deacetylase family protein [Thermosediminibacter litoriperuensis]TYP54301.1 polysaccharide deacetylase family sporulation protein PdaB [Thermosediminibacter litoriperuensis]
MGFYVYKVPRNSIRFTVLLLLIAVWMFVKTGLVNENLATFSEGKPIYQAETSKKIMAFTCNVAWGNEFIPKMLEIFEEKGVKITFFIEGRWAEKNPDLLKLIHSKGHEIGNHGYSHAHHSKLSFEENVNEIKRAEEVIEKITGEKTTLFAPPYGEFAQQTIKAAEALNYRLIMWSIDTLDWKKPGVKYIVDKVIKNAGSGKIVLMHPTEETVTALPTIIQDLQQKGYKITTVGDLLSDNH